MRRLAMLLGLLLMLATTAAALAHEEEVCAKHEDPNVGGPYGDCADKPHSHDDDDDDDDSGGGGGGGGDRHEGWRFEMMHTM